MRCKLDENLPADAAGPLIRAGHDTATVFEQNMSGWADDDLVRVMGQEQRVLITLDLDFCDIRAYPPSDLPGIIVLRLKSQARDSVVDAVEELVKYLSEESPVGKLWVLEKGRLRIRG